MTIDTFLILKSALEGRGISFDKITTGEGKQCWRANSVQGNSLLMPLDGFTYPFASSLAKQLSVDKIAAYTYAESLGITIPKTFYIIDYERDGNEAEKFLSEQKIVVAKPSSGSLSNGVTRDINAPAQLHDAWEIAHRVSPTVILQKQFTGEEYRFVVANHEIVAVLMRKKASVIGDGIHTIEELIKSENRERAALRDTRQTYPLLDEKLVESTALHSQRIASEGEYVELAKGTRVVYGASMYEVRGSVHQDYLRIAERLTTGIGNGFMVVDLMIDDPAAPVSAENYVFLEYNSSPALAPFYSCRDGNHFPIAERILAPMLESIIDASYR